MLDKHNKIWETHLFTYINAEHHDIKKGALDFIYMLLDMGSKSDTAPNTKYKLYETDFRLFDRNESEEIQSIRRFCRDSVLDAVEKVNGIKKWNAEVEFRSAWAHISNNGGFHDTHAHPSCSWCGIYTVDQGDCKLGMKNGINKFISPFSTHSYRDAGTRYMAANESWDVVPMDGTLTIFPSYLLHSSWPYIGKIDRVVISFNSRINDDLIYG